MFGRRSALLLLGALVSALVVSGCGSATHSGYVFDWSVFFQSIFQPDGLILTGLWLTISIAIVSQLIGVLLGVFGALGKMAKFVPFRIIANVYIWFFRGTPLLVQMVILYFGIPIVGLYSWPAINLFGFAIPSEVQAGIFALSVNEGAYMSEIVRAGILSIDAGQSEAGKTLGMTYGQIMRRIVLPQAARVIVPPLGNEFNNMLKSTSLLVILSVAELFVTFERKNGTLFKPFELFLACAVWYLVLTTIWGVIQSSIERRLGKGVAGASAGPTLRRRFFGIGRSPEASVPARAS